MNLQEHVGSLHERVDSLQEGVVNLQEHVDRLQERVDSLQEGVVNTLAACMNALANNTESFQLHAVQRTARYNP